MGQGIRRRACRSIRSEGDCNIVSKLSWSQLWTVGVCKEKAESEERKRYPLWGTEDGPGDAFRHMYWSALMTRDLGVAIAKYVGDQHENIESGNKPDRKAMDLHNNHLGRLLALQGPRKLDAGLADACADAIRKGRARIILKTEKEAEEEWKRRAGKGLEEPY